MTATIRYVGASGQDWVQSGFRSGGAGAAHRRGQLDGADGSLSAPSVVEDSAASLADVSWRASGLPGGQSGGGWGSSDAVRRVIVLEDGVVSASLLLDLHDDLDVEGNETALLQLSEPQGGAWIGPQGTAIIRIIEDDEGRPVPECSVFEAAGGSTPFAWTMRHHASGGPGGGGAAGVPDWASRSLLASEEEVVESALAGDAEARSVPGLREGSSRSGAGGGGGGTGGGQDNTWDSGSGSGNALEDPRAHGDVAAVVRAQAVLPLAITVHARAAPRLDRSAAAGTGGLLPGDLAGRRKPRRDSGGRGFGSGWSMGPRACAVPGDAGGASRPSDGAEDQTIQFGEMSASGGVRAGAAVYLVEVWPKGFGAGNTGGRTGGVRGGDGRPAAAAGMWGGRAVVGGSSAEASGAGAGAAAGSGLGLDAAGLPVAGGEVWGSLPGAAG